MALAKLIGDVATGLLGPRSRLCFAAGSNRRM